MVEKVNRRKIGRIELCSQWVLLSLLGYGRILDIIDYRLDSKEIMFYPAKKWIYRGKIIFRFIIITIFWDVIITQNLNFQNMGSNFQYLFSLQQIISVAAFSIVLLILRVFYGVKLIQLINRFIKLNMQLTEITNHNILFSKQFLILTCLKGSITIMGYSNELPIILNVESMNFNKWLNIAIGIYLWLGSMFILDACYLGFLSIALMYRNLGRYLKITINRMKNFELENKFESTRTTYQRITLACTFSDKLDNINQIYSNLFKFTKEFICLFQWHILYYIYYNFTVIFLLLNFCIPQYIRYNNVDIINIFMVLVKISNLAVLIICANYIVKKSEIPNQLNLDVVCSNIDMRWDSSVETFLSHRKVENMEIKILGLFPMNNQFILTIFSAIISYLFLIIQFGMSSDYK